MSGAPDFPGYTLGKRIHESNASNVYLATRDEDSHPVVLKVDMKPGSHMVHRELAVLQRLSHPHIVQAMGIVEGRGMSALVEQHVVGHTLKHACKKGQLSAEDSLRISTKIVEALEYVHGQDIYHQDVKPQNIVISATDEGPTPTLLDFSVSTFVRQRMVRHSKNEPAGSVLMGAVGTYAYIAPENTGRTNFPRDHRADLYSLGCTMYEMFAGEPPFPLTDASRLIHAHIATPAPSLTQRNVPVAIARVVAKLLEKDPELRYQSATGLRLDLEALAADADLTHSIEWLPGSKDVSIVLDFDGEKLVGRSSEIEQVYECMMHTFRARTLSVLEVAGAAGIGKSALVRELINRVPQSYFIRGKYDQFNQGKPFAAVLLALQDLVHQLVAGVASGMPDTITSVKAIKEAMGNEARVLVDLLPDFALLVGSELPEAPQLPPAQAAARLNMLFVMLFRVLARHSNRAVCMFLDDMQWTDPASLVMLRELIEAGIEHVSLVFAFRPNEVPAEHPYARFRKIVDEQQVEHTHLELGELSDADVVEMTADLLHGEVEDAAIKELAALVFKKTFGNPFFVNRFLSALYQDGMFKLATDSGEARWTWDLEAIASREHTENVVDFMVSRVQLVSEDAREMLQVAAAVGNQFSVPLLALIMDKPVHELECTLIEALADGVVQRREDGECFFLHDRVQQACYQLIGAEKKSALHRTIGVKMLADLEEGAEGQHASVFEIANHLNSAKPEPLSELAVRAAALNLQAGRIALQNNAYSEARDYAEAGLGALGGESVWTHAEHIEIAFDLSEVLVEVLFLLLEHDAANALIDKLFTVVSDKKRKYALYHTRISSYTVLNKGVEALTSGIECLGTLFGLEMSLETDIGKVVTVDVPNVDKLVAGRSVEQLLKDVPRSSDWELEAQVTVLMDLVPMSFITGFKGLFLHLQTEGVRLCLEQGFCAASGGIFGVYGFSLQAFFERMTDGFGLTMVGKHVCDELDASADKPRTYCHVGMTSYLVQPYSESINMLSRAFDLSQQFGDVGYATWSTNFGIWGRFCAGRSLQDVITMYEDGHSYVVKAGNPIALMNTMGLYRHALRLMGRVSAEDHAEWWEEHNNAEMAPPFAETGHYTFQLMNCVLFGNHAGATAVRDKFDKPITENMMGMYPYYEWPGLYVLSASMEIAALRERNDAESEETKARIAELLANMENKALKVHNWAAVNPTNFAAREKLCLAEIRRASGNLAGSLPLYSQAWNALPKDGSLLHVGGLIKERQAELFDHLGMAELFGDAIRAANTMYNTWGARAKVRQLRGKYPLLNQRTHSTVNTTRQTSTVANTTLGSTAFTPGSDGGTTTEVGDSVDFYNTLRASMALAEEVKPARLLKRMLEVVVECAGAQYGGLLAMERVARAKKKVKDDEDTEIDGVILRTVAHAGEGGIETRAVNAPMASSGAMVPSALCRYVMKTRETLVIQDASTDRMFSGLDYIVNKKVKSVLALPVVHRGRLLALIYLESTASKGVFTHQRQAVLSALTGHLGIALQNAQMFANMEAARKEAEEAAATKLEFLANMSHEIRTPLSGIIGMVDMVMEKAESLPEDVRGMVTSMAKSGDLLLESIDTILEMTKLDSERFILDRKPFVVANLLGETKKSFVEAHKDKYELEIDVKAEGMPYSLKGDAPRVGHILNNVVTNCVRFMEGSSKVTMSVQAGDPNDFEDNDNEDATTATGSHSSWTLSRREGTVVDTMSASSGGMGARALLHFVITSGCSIASERLERLFQPFGAQDNNNITRQFGGTGLGFLIARKLAAKMGGKVWFESGSNGSEFHVLLQLEVDIEEVPAHFSTAKVLADISKPAAAGAGGKRKKVVYEGRPLRVLVVEDDRTNQKVIGRMLSKFGHEHVVAEDGQYGVEASLQEKFDVILMDIHMPRMDGYGATQAIRSDPKNPNHRTVIVAVTADAVDAALRKALRVGMSDVMTKPVRRGVLAECLMRVTDKSHPLPTH